MGRVYGPAAGRPGSDPHRQRFSRPSRGWLASFVPLVACAVLAGCANVPDLGPPPQPQAPETLASSLSFSAPVADWPTDRWWTAYGDPQLDRLIDEALAGSPTLAQAEARERRADALVQQARGGLRPEAAVDVQLSGVKQSRNLGLPSVLTPGGVNSTGRIGLALEWDADLFGRNRAALAAAVSDAAAQRLESEQARLMLTSSLVAAYADLVRLHADRDIVAQALEARRAMTRVTDAKVRAGLANAAERAQTEASESGAAGELALLDEQIRLAGNRIAALAGEGPDRALKLERPAKVSDTAFGLPADLAVSLIGRRPDLSAARIRVEAAASRVKVARAGFYPNINLLAYLGMQALPLSRLLQAGSSVGQAGAALNLPIFNSSRLEGAYGVARADYDAAVAAYDETLVQALREVADSAAGQRALEARLAEARSGLAAREVAFRMARLRYKGGIDTLLSVGAAEDEFLDQQRRVADLEARRFLLDAQLARALGGGFRIDTPRRAATVTP